jgi:endonuclease-3
MDITEKVEIIINRLKKLYPNPKLELEFENEFQLLVMAILSAQESDKKVNKVAKRLFQRWKTPAEFANLDVETLAREIKEIHWNHQKAKWIINCCQKLLELYNGRVPDDVNKLVKLPGVGRKTANMVVGGAFKKPAIIADRHFIRVANRLGLTKEKTPDKVEKDLAKKIPKKYWLDLSLLLITHGKRICTAKKPKCEGCPIRDVCDYYKEREKERD